MPSFTRRSGVVVISVAGLMTSACASFPAEKLKDSQIPDASGKPYRPTAYVEVKYFHGTPGDAKATELPDGKVIAQQVVDRVLQKANLFSSYTFDSFKQDKVDQVVHLKFYNYGNPGAATAAGVLTGYTLGLIPTAATDNYTVLAEASSKQEGAHAAGATRSDDTVTTWVGLWFLPFAGKTATKARDSTFEELTRDAFRQLVATNQLQFEAPKPATVAVPAPEVAAPVVSPVPVQPTVQPPAQPTVQPPAQPTAAMTSPQPPAPSPQR